MGKITVMQQRSDKPCITSTLIILHFKTQYFADRSLIPITAQIVQLVTVRLRLYLTLEENYRLLLVMGNLSGWQ